MFKSSLMLLFTLGTCTIVILCSLLTWRSITFYKSTLPSFCFIDLEGPPALGTTWTCQDILKRFIGRGHFEIDTAPMYGECQRIIGSIEDCRSPEKVSISTKVDPWEEKSLKYESVLSQAEMSLKSLQVPCVDLFYLHIPDHQTPIAETLKAVDELYRDGKFKRFGLSNYAAWEVSEIYYLCKQNNWVLPTVYQGMYNGICRMVEGELFPCLRNFGIAFYAYNPLAMGILTGKFKYNEIYEESSKHDGRYFAENKLKQLYQKRFWRKPVFEGVELIQKALDDSYGANKVSLVSAAFRWLNHHSKLSPDRGDGIVLGLSSLQQLDANLNACEEGPLTQAVVDAFDQAWELDKGNCANYYR